MLTEITVGNFKAFQEPQSLELRRVNAIFGPNSAGKSSFIHALLLAQTAFRTGDFDVRRISTDVDLGGFRGFVHGQDIHRNVHMSLKVAPQKHKANGGIRSIRIVLEIGMHFGQVSPKFIQYFVDDIPVLELKAGNDPPNLDIGNINIASPLLSEIREQFTKKVASLVGKEVENQFRDAIASFIQRVLRDTTLVESRYFFTDSYRTALERKASASHTPKPIRRKDPWVNPELRDLEPVHDTLTVVQLLQNKSALRVLLGDYLDDVFAVLDSPQAGPLIQRLRQGQHPKKGEARPEWWAELFNPLHDSAQRIEKVSAILHGARRLRRHVQEIAVSLQSYVTEEIDPIVHVGPLRWYPEKIIEGEPLSSHHESTTGEAAWLRLVDDAQLREQVNTTLQRLGLHYAVTVRSLYDHDSVLKLLDGMQRGSPKDRLQRFLPARRELLLTDIRSGLNVRHRDVGVGISQVIPAIVNTLAAQPHQLTSIEQPELHLHPRLQTELADVFVEAANTGRTVFLETHSEHLLLRLLRRIRETTEQRAPSPELRFKIAHLQVVYAEPTAQGTKMKTLEITPQGEFAHFWPEGFFADRAEELY